MRRLLVQIGQGESLVHFFVSGFANSPKSGRSSGEERFGLGSREVARKRCIQVHSWRRKECCEICGRDHLQKKYDEKDVLTSALDMPEIMLYIYSKSWKLQFSASSSIIIIEDYYLQTFLHSLSGFPSCWSPSVYSR